ncbi:hypothetical protein DT076_11270 [Desertihabitans brevis]|uniref:Uncharacterized protein n=2 Tax=Desertihabitans brevis TaxID=2268447 RepID=A0A367YU84_9ACTN|nr:hypothetical protein DT076_11270 [Desertihabitans brevis]
MAVGEREVLIHSAESGTTDLVRDGEPARRVRFEETMRGAQLVPGPAGTVWQVSGAGGGELTVGRWSLAGEPLTPTDRLPGLLGWGASTGDGAGGLLLSGVGGVWLLDAAQPPQRVTRGRVLAAGPRVLLTVDCDERMRCQRLVHDRRTGTDRVLGPARPDDAGRYPGSASTSPDGRWLVEPGGFARGGFRVVDLATNREVAALEAELGFADPAGSAVWTPDNRLLLVAEGRLVVVDPVAGRSVTPDVELAGVRRIALRA